MLIANCEISENFFSTCQLRVSHVWKVAEASYEQPGPVASPPISAKSSVAWCGHRFACVKPGISVLASTVGFSGSAVASSTIAGELEVSTSPGRTWSSATTPTPP